MVSTLDFESNNPSSILGMSSFFILTQINNLPFQNTKTHSIYKILILFIPLFINHPNQLFKIPVFRKIYLTQTSINSNISLFWRRTLLLLWITFYLYFHFHLWCWWCQRNYRFFQNCYFLTTFYHFIIWIPKLKIWYFAPFWIVQSYLEILFSYWISQHP